MFPQLKVLCIWDCPNLLSFNFSEGFSGNLESLESLEIKDCPRLKSFPDEGLPTPNLSTMLVFNCKDLNKLPTMNSLTSLATFFLHECPKIECLPYGGMPSSLIQLSISDCDKLTPQKDWGLVHLEYLSHFQFIGERIGMKSFPEENLLPSCVISLHIGTMQSLKKLDDKGFQHLNSLKTLAIHCCDKLKSFPEQGLPDSVRSLCIQKCRKLAKKLKYTRGVEWHKVSHIKRIEIDDKVMYQRLPSLN
ncbi:putative disease resistance protein At3g14460 [Lotus japonicus]|uniref:putative disease resistance protein At3g14460 n=1 Tax=Lotus japonicus TaxID=34305 RepID=UPI00258B44E5|nr:putative disease resistance protein At3g14460 [Lotus japonicus]